MLHYFRGFFKIEMVEFAFSSFELSISMNDLGVCSIFKHWPLQAILSQQEGRENQSMERITELQDAMEEERNKATDLLARIFKAEALLEEKKERIRCLLAELELAKQTAATTALTPHVQQPQAPMVFTFPGVHPSLPTNSGKA